MTVTVPGSLTFTYLEDGSTTVFSYPVRFLEASELLVIREAADGVRTTLVYNSDYTVSGAGNANGGSITRTAVTNGGKIIITRSTIPKQLVDLKDAQRNPAEAVEIQLDRMAMAGQDLRDRALALAPGVSLSEGHFPEMGPDGFRDGGSSVDIKTAQANAEQAAAILALFNTQYLGAYASHPATDPNGGAIQQGAFYWSTASKTWFYWDGTGWGTFPFATVADGAVTAAKLADDAVTEPKHATGSVSTRALADGSATLTKIGDDAKADFRLVDPNGALPRGTYNGPTSFRVDVDEYAMGGFWFRGRYKQGRARVVATPDTIFDWTTDYGAGTINLKNWQACFLCAKAGDTVAVPKIMPYLRVMSVAGNVITLNKAGEGIDGAVAATDYGWAVNALVGCQCLVISESGQWSRFRTTTVTANTKTTVTLADIGTIGGLFNGAASLDWILIAPPGYAADEFAWVADFYADTVEVRNIYVGGGTARAKMIYILASSYQTGSVPLPGVWINAGGYISPLATGLTVDLTSQFSTVSTGSFAEYLAGDTGNHILQTAFGQKLTATTETITNDGMRAAFLYHQRFVYANGGSMVSSRSGGQINITGWDY